MASANGTQENIVMKRKQKTPTPAKQQDENHGEGNPEAARRFNKAEREFVESPAGRAAIAANTKDTTKKRP
jgi:hypothetical protein